ncbi:Uncharacterised protein [Neisseria meningitidis]|nr:Uncharacterised protein [Neisseria meningitidis]
MAVSFDKSVSGKMFTAGFHTAFFQTFLKGEGKAGDRFGIAVETAVADDGAVSPVQIQDGSEGQVDAAGGKFGCQNPAYLPGCGFGGGRAVFVPNLP